MINLFNSIKVLHIIAMVAWFAGLFYLPRLFVYHSITLDIPGIERFKIMERRLYYAITWPAAIVTTITGLFLLYSAGEYYWHAGWMHAKLLGVALLWGFHLCCGRYLRKFARDNNNKSERFYRIFNEVPTLLLIIIVVLVVMKP